MSMNWGPGADAGFQNALSMGLDLGKVARQGADKREYEKALGALAVDPGNVNALATVYQHNPQVGAMLQDRASEDAFRRDQGAFVSGNALLRFAPPAPGAVGSGARGPALPSASAGTNGAGALPLGGDLATPSSAGSVSSPTNQAVGLPPQAAPVAAHDAAKGPDLSNLGQPQTPADQAFLRMLQRDPLQALKIQSALRDNFLGQAEAESKLYGLAIEELSRATDPATWQAARGRVMADADALGLDAASAVPVDYPGPDGVKELMARAMPIKDQLDLMLRTANVEADNARADRTATSLIDTRKGRLAEYRRHNLANEGNARRGQDIRARSAGGGRGRGSGGGGASDLPVMSSPAEAMKLPSGTRFRTPDGMVKVRP